MPSMLREALLQHISRGVLHVTAHATQGPVVNKDGVKLPCAAHKMTVLCYVSHLKCMTLCVQLLCMRSLHRTWQKTK